jgi:preprotein translocase subunit SecA
MVKRLKGVADYVNTLSDDVEKLSDAELRAKFRACAAPVIGGDAADGVAEQLEHLEDIPDIRALTSRLTAEKD